METADQCAVSSSEVQQESWAKLISVNSNLPNLNLYHEPWTFSENLIHEIHTPYFGQQDAFKIYKDSKCYWIELISSSDGVYIDDDFIENGEKKKITSGDTIYLRHPSKVHQSEVKGYIFSGMASSSVGFKRRREEELNVIEKENDIGKQPKPENEPDREFLCGFCHHYVYQCVTARPCLHNFCGACLSEWVTKATICPECTEEIIEIRRNYILNNTVQTFLQGNPSKRRFFKEYKNMKSKNRMQKDRIILNEFLKNGQKLSNGTHLSVAEERYFTSNAENHNRDEEHSSWKVRAVRQTPVIKAARKCIAWIPVKTEDDNNSNQYSSDEDDNDGEEEQGEDDHEFEEENENEEERNFDSIEDIDGLEVPERVKC